MTVTDLAQKLVRPILQDTTAGALRWSDDELLEWSRAGIREILASAPRASVMTIPLPLEAGTRQNIATIGTGGGIKGMVLLDVVRNMGTDGTAPGAPIREISVQSLDAMIPGWHLDSASASAIYFVKDRYDPRTFYLYPPRPASAGYATVVIEAMADLTGLGLGSAIPLADQYLNALADYVCFRCFSENMAVPNASERAKFHLAAFQASMASAESLAAAPKPQPPQPQAQG